VRQTVASGGPWEARYGYARAVAVGGHLWVSGSTSVVGGEIVHGGDPAAQTRTAFTVALDAAREAGFAVTDVVRTRMFVVDLPANGDAVATVHGEMFGEVRPATTMVGVAGLIDPALLVEVEVDCYREDSR
jgi:enamine deaminase RidA (YjgF/YER057c/UK114 family)